MRKLLPLICSKRKTKRKMRTVNFNRKLSIEMAKSCAALDSTEKVFHLKLANAHTHTHNVKFAVAAQEWCVVAHDFSQGRMECSEMSRTQPIRRMNDNLSDDGFGIFGTWKNHHCSSKQNLRVHIFFLLLLFSLAQMRRDTHIMRFKTRSLANLMAYFALHHHRITMNFHYFLSASHCGRRSVKMTTTSSTA